MEKKSVILACTHEDCLAAVGYGCRLAHMDYRINKEGRLFRGAPPCKGGYMVICADSSQPVPDDIRFFCRQMLTECSANGFCGVIADIEGPDTENWYRFLNILCTETARNSLSFIAPLNFSPGVSQQAKLLMPSSISGGCYEEYISEFAAKFPGRLILEVQQNCEDFTMPCSDGCGKRLSQREMDEICGRYMPVSFFSRDLQTNYFTYQDSGKNMHCVLFDTAKTIKSKIELACSLGVNKCIMLYPEVCGILRDIF